MPYISVRYSVQCPFYRPLQGAIHQRGKCVGTAWFTSSLRALPFFIHSRWAYCEIRADLYTERYSRLYIAMVDNILLYPLSAFCHTAHVHYRSRTSSCSAALQLCTRPVSDSTAHLALHPAPTSIPTADWRPAADRPIARRRHRDV